MSGHGVAPTTWRRGGGSILQLLRRCRPARPPRRAGLALPPGFGGAGHRNTVRAATDAQPPGRRLLIAAATAIALAAAAPLARAGRSCEQQPPSVDSVQRGMALAQHTAQALDASGAQVVVLARAGQDLSRWGLRYSHLGFAYRDGAVWRVAHELNRCGSAQSGLYRQGLGEFFLDDLFEYQAAWVVPTPEVQARLLPALRDDGQLARLHSPAYNMLAYPWAQTYQQSNQWAIETLAMTQDVAVADSRERAQAWLKLHDYQPARLTIGALTRLGARLTAANIAFDDQPTAQRFADRIETVTVDSVFAWLNRSGLGGGVQVVR